MIFVFSFLPTKSRSFFPRKSSFPAHHNAAFSNSITSKEACKKTKGKKISTGRTSYAVQSFISACVTLKIFLAHNWSKQCKIQRSDLMQTHQLRLFWNILFLVNRENFWPQFHKGVSLPNRWPGQTGDVFERNKHSKESGCLSASMLWRRGGGVFHVYNNNNDNGNKTRVGRYALATASLMSVRSDFLSHARK